MTCEHTWPTGKGGHANLDDPSTYYQHYYQHRCSGVHEYGGGYELHVCRYCQTRTFARTLAGL